MAVDLFSLRMNLQTTGTAQAMGALRGVEQQGARTAAGLNGVAAGFSRAELAARSGEAASLAVASRFGAFGGVLTALGPIGLAAGGVLATLGFTMRATAPEADALRLSMLRLDGASRLTGISLSFLQQISRQTQDAFKLSVVQANDLTAAAAKVAAKTGDLNQAGPFLAAWLNVAAAQGLGASQALEALNITLRGQDEGLDRIFQKNPSVIWKEYAESIGTTVGKLTEQQKWQSIVNATMEGSVKVGDAYNRFLDTAAGKSTILAAAAERFQAAIGRFFEPIRAWVSDVGATFLNFLSGVIERMERISTLRGLGGLRDAMGLGPDFGDVAAGGTSSAGAPVEPGALGRPTTPTGPTSGAVGGETATQRRARLLAILDAEAAAVLAGGGTPPGLRGPVAVRGGPTGPFTGGSFDSDPQRSSILTNWANRLEIQARAVRQQFAQLGQNLGMVLANGFAAAMQAGMQGKNIFKAFGNAVLQGLGSIFTQMGAELMAYGVIMLNLLPFLSNPFTSGPAAIAAGAALVALGTVLGGIATSPGGGKGGGGFDRDRTTKITLTADGMGGLTSPVHKGPLDGVALLAVDSPQGERVIATTMGRAKRRGF